MNSSTVEASITPSSSPSSLSDGVVTTSTSPSSSPSSSSFPSTSTFKSTSTPASSLPSSSPSNLMSSLSSTGKISIIGVFIIVVVGLFYFVKLLIRKRKKRINKEKKLRKRSGNYDNKHNSTLNLSGTNRSNNWTPSQEEEMMGKHKKVTAADHLNSVKKKFNGSNNINKKKRRENINFELECEKLNSIASRNVQSKIYDSFNDLSSSGSSSNNNTTQPIRNTLTNNIESPQPVHFHPSSPLAS